MYLTIVSIPGKKTGREQCTLQVSANGETLGQIRVELRLADSSSLKYSAPNTNRKIQPQDFKIIIKPDEGFSIIK